MIGNSNDKTNISHKLLLTNRQVATLRRAFANYLLVDIKLSKIQLSKIVQSGRVLGRPHGPLLKAGLPLMTTVFEPLGKSALIPLGLTVAAAATGIHIKILGSGTTTLIISNEKMKTL